MDEKPVIANDHKSQKSNNPMIAIGAIAVVAVIAFVLMRSNGNKASSTEQTVVRDQAQQAAAVGDQTTPTVAGASDSTVVDATVKTIEVEAGSFYYKPNVINVKKGDKVKIVMTSKDMIHDFNIDELNVRIPKTKSGDTSTVEFTADKVGTFEYYCSVGQHRKMGQVGKLNVE